MKRFLAWVLVLSLLLCALPLTSLAASKTATVKGGWLRLRDKPSENGKVLGSYYTGDVVTVLGTYGRWYHVRTASGQKGYMDGVYLNVNGKSAASSSSKTTKGTTAYVTSKNGAPVWLRYSAGTGSKAIAKYNVGTKATILKRGTSWHYVRIGNRQGYMMASCLSATKPAATAKPTVKPTATPKPASSYVAYIKHPNGLKVNVRSGPSRSHSVVSAYPVGTKVTVLEHGSTWCRIRVQNKLGYIMTQFLTTKKPGTK